VKDEAESQRWQDVSDRIEDFCGRISSKELDKGAPGG